MQVIRNEEVLYDRDQLAVQLTQLIAAIRFFHRRGGEQKNAMVTFLKTTKRPYCPLYRNMAQEIGRSVAIFLYQHPHNRVDHIMLKRHGSAPLPGLTEAVTQQTGFACSAVNPFDGMEIEVPR